MGVHTFLHLEPALVLRELLVLSVITIYQLVRHHLRAEVMIKTLVSILAGKLAFVQIVTHYSEFR